MDDGERSEPSGDADTRMRDAGHALADAVEEVLPGWVVRSVERLVVAWVGAASTEVMDEARAAAAGARTEVGGRLREVVTADVDEQAVNPLELLRQAVRHPAAVLRRAGVPDIERDRWDEERFPDDVYGLTPMTWSDVDERLTEPGIRWGAAKALAHRARHG